MENFGKIMAILLGLILAPIITGFVFLKLWSWFVVPITDLQALTLFQAIGLMLLIGFVTAKYKKPDNDKKFWVDYISQISFLITTSAFTLLFGYIASLFV